MKTFNSQEDCLSINDMPITKCPENVSVGKVGPPDYSTLAV